MKKYIQLCTFFLAVILCLASCVVDTPTNTTPSISTSPNSDVYESLNQMVSEEYSSLTVEVQTQSSFGTLHSVYDIHYSSKTVDYTEESFNAFENVDGEWVLPDEYKTTESGTLSFGDGQPLQLPNGLCLSNFGEVNFSFAENYFSAIVSEEHSFSANVIDIAGFLGQPADATDMTLSICFEADRFVSIFIEYQTLSGTSVTMTYLFQPSL